MFPQVIFVQFFSCYTSNLVDHLAVFLSNLVRVGASSVNMFKRNIDTHFRMAGYV